MASKSNITEKPRTLIKSKSLSEFASLSVKPFLQDDFQHYKKHTTFRHVEHKHKMSRSKSLIGLDQITEETPETKPKRNSHPNISGFRRSASSVEFLLPSLTSKKDKSVEKAIKPVLPHSASMSDFSPESNVQLVNQLYQELKKVKPPSVSRESHSIKVYNKRWYILIIFSLVSGLQSYVWNFWGPIAGTSEHVYGWSDSDIAFYANWGPICYIPMVLPFTWLISTKGLRWSLLSASALVAVGSGLRCIITEPPYNKWMVHSGHLLNGVAGPIGKAMGPVISAVWFPPNQRTTATAIMSGFPWFAVGISCIAGPLLVPETYQTLNTTSSFNSSTDVYFNETEQIREIEKENINYYLYGAFGVCAVVFVMAVVYFPAKPPRPPSLSASVKRLDYKAGIIQLIQKRRSFWFIAVLYGSSTGMREAWSSMLNVNLKAHGISQLDAGWIGFYSSIAGWVAGIVIARFTETFKRRFKLFLLILYFLSTIMYIWLTLTLVDILPSSKVSLYTSIIISSIIIGSTTPLFYEAACEIAYPISEGIANLVLTMQANIASLIFLGVLSIPNIGTIWMNWLLIATFGTCTVALLFMKEVYTRSDVDDKNNDDVFL